MKIDCRRTLDINSFPMLFRLWSDDENNPILLFVHGGPGGVFRHKIRDYLLPLCDRYTLATYDQRGCGGSYLSSIKPSDLTIEGYVDDLIMLGKYLRGEFPNVPIYLICESFGTQIGSLAIIKEPALFKAYLGYGQMVNEQKALTIQYKMTWKAAKQNDDKEAMAILKKIGKPVEGKFKTVKDLNVFFSLFYALVFDPGKASFEEREVDPFLASNEYSPKEKKGWKRGMGLSQRAVKHFKPVNLEGNSYQIPYYVFQGKEDIICPTAIVPPYVAGISAPKKEVMIFRDCGHLVAFEKPRRFMDELRKRLK